MSETNEASVQSVVMQCETCDALRLSESHWRLQYKFACRALANFIELIDAADGCMIEPPPEVVEVARFHAGNSAA